MKIVQTDESIKNMQTKFDSFPNQAKRFFKIIQRQKKKSEI